MGLGLELELGLGKDRTIRDDTGGMVAVILTAHMQTYLGGLGGWGECIGCRERV